MRRANLEGSRLSGVGRQIQTFECWRDPSLVGRQSRRPEFLMMALLGKDENTRGDK